MKGALAAASRGLRSRPVLAAQEKPRRRPAAAVQRRAHGRHRHRPRRGRAPRDRTSRGTPSRSSKTAPPCRWRNSPTSASRSASACCSTSATACSGARFGTPGRGRTLPAEAARTHRRLLRHGVQSRAAAAVRLEDRPEGVHEALERLKPTGTTAIYDALSASMPFIENRPRERAAIVLITDGEDTRQRALAARSAPGTDPQPTPSSTRSRSTRRSRRRSPNAQPRHAERDHRPERRPDGSDPLGGGSRRGDREHRRGAEQPVRARVLLARTRRRQVPQHPRPGRTREGHRVRARNGYVAARKRSD